MKPTLEEVKEYFKNAKEVFCLCNEITVDVSDMEIMERELVFVFGYGDFSKVRCFDKKTNEYAKIISYKEEIKTPTHYDNSKGSIYKFCNDQNLNSWEFDIIKRVVRSRKKGNFKEDLEKTKHLIDLYLKEYDTTGTN